MNFRVGTAGWTVPKQHQSLFSAPLSADADAAEPASHLQRYARTLRCVEINSTFYKSHRPGTWARWAATTPSDFRFSVKLPKAITHAARLRNTGALLQAFFAEVSALGHKLGPVLVQLPPRLVFDDATTHEFLTTLRELHRGPVALEPRNSSWFTAASSALLTDFEVARVAADPAKASDLAASPGAWPGLRYWRLHGSPRTYYSNYEEPWLQDLAAQLAANAAGPGGETWIIFDNTALGHATSNAIHLARSLGER